MSNASIVVKLSISNHTGAGESGKTTIIKQMKILHVSGFSDNERREKAAEIRTNIVEAIKEIVSHMALIKPPVELAHQANADSLEYVNNLDITDTTFEFTDEFYAHVKRLWLDPGVQSCYKRSNEYPLIDCAK